MITNVNFQSLLGYINHHKHENLEIRPFVPLLTAAREASIDQNNLTYRYRAGKIEGFKIRQHPYLYIDSFHKYFLRRNFEEEQLLDLIIQSIISKGYIFEDEAIEKMKFDLSYDKALDRLHSLLTRLSIKSCKHNCSMIWANVPNRNSNLPSGKFFNLLEKLNAREMVDYYDEEINDKIRLVTFMTGKNDLIGNMTCIFFFRQKPE